MTMPFSASWRVMYAVIGAIVVCAPTVHAQGSNGPEAVAPFRIQVPEAC